MRLPPAVRAISQARSARAIASCALVSFGRDVVNADAGGGGDGLPADVRNVFLDGAPYRVCETLDVILTIRQDSEGIVAKTRGDILRAG